MTENRETAKAVNKLFLYLIGQDPATLATQALIRKQIAIEEHRTQHQKNIIVLEKKGQKLKTQTPEEPNSPEKLDNQTEVQLKQWEKEYHLEQDLLDGLEIPDSESFEGDTEAPEADESPIEYRHNKPLLPNPEFSHHQNLRHQGKPDTHSARLRNTRSQLNTASQEAA